VNPFAVTYDVAPDGKRFVMSFASEEENLPLTLVSDWATLLRNK
jgi:hypothetical protein